MIKWLTRAVSDDRFSFSLLDAHNEMYNPKGVRLADFDALPVGSRSFDLICGFSLFTHLNPGDFEAMLRLMLQHAHSETKLLFSLYLTRPDGSGIMLGPGDSPPRARFVDEVAEQPLAIARYDEDYAVELLGAAGWEVESVNAPAKYIQHWIVAQPAVHTAT